MINDDLIIEDFFEDTGSEKKKKKKKKVNGKAKGNRTELNLCKFLTKHFGEEFSRALGSGARTSQVSNLPEHAKRTLTGDICVPDGFKWGIECKGGYEDDMHLENICDGNLSRLDEFIEQVQKDADYCNRKPIILWKRNRKPWIAMYKECHIPKNAVEDFFDNYIQYGDWLIVNLEDLLNKTKKEIWFEQKENSSN